MARKFTQADMAYHEAGHAVVARTLGLGVTHVALFPTSDDSLAVAQSVSAAYKVRDSDAAAQIQAFEQDVKVCLAGPLAQYRHRPVKTTAAWSDDITNAKNHIAWMVALGDGTAPPDSGNEPDRILGKLDNRQITQVRAVFERVQAETAGIVKKNWPAIERVAEALLQRSLLSEADLDALITGQTAFP